MREGERKKTFYVSGNACGVYSGGITQQVMLFWVLLFFGYQLMTCMRERGGGGDKKSEANESHGTRKVLHSIEAISKGNVESVWNIKEDCCQV